MHSGAAKAATITSLNGASGIDEASNECHQRQQHDVLNDAA